MDLLEVLKPFFDFLIEYLNIQLTVGGFSFTIGALFLWCALVLVVIWFLKGLAD